MVITIKWILPPWTARWVCPAIGTWELNIRALLREAKSLENNFVAIGNRKRKHCSERCCTFCFQGIWIANPSNSPHSCRHLWHTQFDGTRRNDMYKIVWGPTWADRKRAAGSGMARLLEKVSNQAESRHSKSDCLILGWSDLDQSFDHQPYCHLVKL